MASAALDAPARQARLSPGAAFWALGLLVYGAAAINFAGGHFLEQTSRDLWQHLAALRALIEDPVHPANPFVPTDEGSRHFHPYWVAVAAAARLLGWNEWQAIAAAGFASGGVLLAGIWTFARAFYRHAWAPLALLAAMTLGWALPISHTGYHSLTTLIEGAAYPASLMIGLSLLFWALTIRAVEGAGPAAMAALAALAALMAATHQLGAGIALVPAGLILLLWPDGGRRARLRVAAAIALGLLLAAAWPYHNPYEAVLRTGNPSWSGGLPFYSPLFLIVAFVPSAIGLAGFVHPRFAPRGRAMLAAFLLFAGLFAAGPLGFPVATRFVMPAVLILHVGMAGLFVLAGEKWREIPRRWQLTAFALAALCVQLHAAAAWANLAAEAAVNRALGSAYDWSSSLTRDVPDGEPVAAYDVAVWPVVATGQRALSVPWPEPMIANLAERQQATERLFDPALTREERLALARRWGVRTLIMDRRGPLRRTMPDGLIERLERQSVRRAKAGPFLRFDLE